MTLMSVDASKKLTLSQTGISKSTAAQRELNTSTLNVDVAGKGSE
jgi:hypothetical protein